MDGEKDGKGQNRHENHHILPGIPGPAADIKHPGQGQRQHQGGDQIDADDGPQPPGKQPQNHLRSAVKTVIHHTAVTVKEENPGHGFPPVQQICHKSKDRQRLGQIGPDRGRQILVQIAEDSGNHGRNPQDYSNPNGRPAQQLPVPFHKKPMEEGTAPPLVGQNRILLQTDFFQILLLHGGIEGLLHIPASLY